MAPHRKLTPELHALKRRVAEALYADDERATMHAVAEYLGVHWRGLLTAAQIKSNFPAVELGDGSVGLRPSRLA